MIIALFLVSCQSAQETVYDVKSVITTLNDKLEEDDTNEDTYIDLFNAYAIINEYFEAVRVIDKALDNTEGDKIKELITDLKDGHDVHDTNGAIYKRILIDYDSGLDQYDINEVNAQYYQGQVDMIDENYTGEGSESFLSSNDQIAL